MPDNDPIDRLRRDITDVLDPSLATSELTDHLALRMIALGTSAPDSPMGKVTSRKSDVHSSQTELRTAVGDVLYEHGLGPDRVGSVLAPHVDEWSPPTPSQLAPLQIDQRHLAQPDEIDVAYDAVVIGSGAGGGVAARSLAKEGWKVLVVERGSLPDRHSMLTEHLHTPRSASELFPFSGPGSDSETRQVLFPAHRVRSVRASRPEWGNNAMTLGGGTRVYGAQAWRFAPLDFTMATSYGIPDGSSLADWPITYEDLEPYYSRIEQDLGVSGGPSRDPWDGPRSAELPMGPLPPSPLGELLDAAADRMNMGTQPVPMLINTRPYAGRRACIQCSQCVGFDCPVGARAGSHNTTLPAALATGNTTILPGAQVARIRIGSGGLATGVDLVGDRRGTRWARQITVRLVVLAAGAIESARLLLDSANDEHPDGLGNDTDQVGRHLQGHTYGGASALFNHNVVDLKGPGPIISTADFRHGNDGVIGGGILANEFVPTPANALRSLYDTGLIDETTPVGSPTAERAMLRFARIMGPVQEVTSEGSRIRLDRRRSDRFGRSIARLEGTLHPEDLRAQELLSTRSAEWLREAGASTIRQMPKVTWPTGPSGGQHQAGTCRMGADPRTSVVDPMGRLWNHENIIVADGSVHVTNGGANPVLTILANALRISEHAARTH